MSPDQYVRQVINSAWLNKLSWLDPALLVRSSIGPAWLSSARLFVHMASPSPYDVGVSEAGVA